MDSFDDRGPRFSHDDDMIDAIRQEWDEMQDHYDRLGQPLGSQGFELWIEFGMLAQVN